MKETARLRAIAKLAVSSAEMELNGSDNGVQELIRLARV